MSESGYNPQGWAAMSKEQRTANRAYQKKRYASLRRQVIQHLGGRCARCGFDDERALQIDHVDGGGNHDVLRRAPIAYLKAVRDRGDGRFQLLCANCNWIKRSEEGEVGP